MKHFCKIHFTILMISTLLLNGCTKTDPVNTIIDTHVDHINQALGYAYNNLEQTKDVIFLENELEMCKTTLQDVKQTHDSQISTYKAKTDYWRLATFVSLIALAGLVFVLIRNMLKVL